MGVNEPSNRCWQVAVAHQRRGFKVLNVPEAVTTEPIDADALAIEREAFAALEARIRALTHLNAVLRAQLEGARKDGYAWRKAAEVAQSLLRNRRYESDR